MKLLYCIELNAKQIYKYILVIQCLAEIFHEWLDYHYTHEFVYYISKNQGTSEISTVYLEKALYNYFIPRIQEDMKWTSTLHVESKKVTFNTILKRQFPQKLVQNPGSTVH